MLFLGAKNIFFFIPGAIASIERLELIMPRYAIRGGDVILKCDHSVPPEQLHKVEWQKGGTKIFQYIKGRNPPFRSFPTAGAELNVSFILTFSTFNVAILFNFFLVPFLTSSSSTRHKPSQFFRPS